MTRRRSSPATSSAAFHSEGSIARVERDLPDDSWRNEGIRHVPGDDRLFPDDLMTTNAARWRTPAHSRTDAAAAQN